MRDIETIKQQCCVASQHVFVLVRLYLGLQLHRGTKWRESKVFMYKILSYFIVCFMRGSHRLQKGGQGEGAIPPRKFMEPQIRVGMINGPPDSFIYSSGSCQYAGL